MMLELRVHQVMSLGNGMVRLILIRRSLKARIEPIAQTEEQRMAQTIATQLQQTLGRVFPGGVVVSGGGSMPAIGEQWDAKIDMEITEQEYNELEKPGINDMIRIDASKIVSARDAEATTT